MFVVATPFATTPEVVCYRDTYDVHLRQGDDLVGLAKETLSSPSLVVSGTTAPDHVIFLNHNQTSNRGSPFAVIVHPATAPPLITSWGYRRDFKDTDGLVVLWKP